jgi:hypothetical protein
MHKRTAILITLVLLIQLVPRVSAKPKGDWNAVKALTDHSVAVRTKTGKTHFGLIQSADDSSITMQIAGRDDFTSQEIKFTRDEVARLWRARLRFGETNRTKAALIGAGAGLGVAVAHAAILAQQRDADAHAGGGLFMLIGAGAGIVVGSFWKKKHKKQELVYSL